MTKLRAFNWRSLLLEDQELKPYAKYLGLYLSTFMNDHNEMAWPSLTRIKHETGLSKNTVIKYLEELNIAGWLVTKKQAHAIQTSGGAQACNQYWIAIPEKVVQEMNHLIFSGSSFDDQRGFISRPKVVHPVNPNSNSNNNTNNNNQKTKFSDEDLETSYFMFDKILILNPNNKPPNLKTWANEIRLMRERDKRTHQQIRDLFTWANNDDFWKTNILSPTKLRQQWDKLVIQKNNKRTKSLGQNDLAELAAQRNIQPRPGESQHDYIARARRELQH